jgi:hypothetical protein
MRVGGQALLRRVDRWDVVGGPLTGAAIPLIYRAAARRAAAQATRRGDAGAALAYAALAQTLTGHSPRFGVVEDMVFAGADVIGICHGLDWKKPKMVLRYCKALRARSTSVARLLRQFAG